MKYEMEGIGAKLLVDDTGVRLTNTAYKEERYIPFGSVLAVAVRQPSLGVFGYIFFLTAGAYDPLMNQTFAKPVPGLLQFKGDELYQTALEVKAAVEPIIQRAGQGR